MRKMDILLTFLLFFCTITSLYTEHVDSLNDEVAHDVQSTTSDSDECLQAHNLLRARHENTPPLTWSDELASEAEEWAKYLIESNNGTMKHSHVRGQGENIFKSSSSSQTGCTNAVKAWYKEINNYNFTTGKTNGGAIGHFTQVVSKRSTQVGVGVAYTKVQNKKNPNKFTTITMVVGKYTPAGNMKGGNLKNVMPLKEGAPMPTVKPAPLCENVDSIGKCKWLANSAKYGPCEGEWKNYFQQKCRKYCGFC